MAMMGGVAALGLGHAAHGLALAVWQSGDSIDTGHATLLIVFIALSTIALVSQAAVLVALGLALLKMQKRVMVIVEEMRVKTLPIIDKSHGLITDMTPKVTHITDTVTEIIADLKPKVKQVSENVTEISHTVRNKVSDFEPTIAAVKQTVTDMNQTASDANKKTHAQITRVDGMISSALSATAELAATIHHGIQVPAREVAGLVSGMKASVDSLKSKLYGFGSGFTSNPARSGSAKPAGKPTNPAPAASSAPAAGTPSTSVPTGPVPTGEAPDVVPAAAAELRNERSFAAYRAAMQAKRRDIAM